MAGLQLNMLALVLLCLAIAPQSNAFSVPQNNEAVLVEEQLGYVPSNFVKVSAWTEQGKPIAIQTYPLDGGAPRRQRKVSSSLGVPFPTLYWLCNAKIGKAIGDLERTGHVSLLQERLNNNPDYARLFRQAHEEYGRERWSSLTLSDRVALETEHEGMRSMLQDSGVAGTDYRITEIPNIKCLHAQYAHYRSSCSSCSNLVGGWVHDLLQEEFSDLIL